MRSRHLRVTLVGVSRWSNTPIETKFRTIEGLTIRFAESEDRDDHALLLSPWPESLLAFEEMWARPAEHTHLVAIDLPGREDYLSSYDGDRFVESMRYVRSYFTWEDAADEYSALVTNWWSGAYATAGMESPR
jgi:hypothetical protein